MHNVDLLRLLNHLDELVASSLAEHFNLQKVVNPSQQRARAPFTYDMPKLEHVDLVHIAGNGAQAVSAQNDSPLRFDGLQIFQEPQLLDFAQEFKGLVQEQHRALLEQNQNEGELRERLEVIEPA